MRERRRGATIDPTTGVFSWTPTETQDGDHTVTVRVTDDGTPTLDDSETFTITVNEVNVAPVLGAIGDRTVDEETELSFTATATDADLPANTLTFSLDAGAPAGAAIDPTTGVFSWTPTETQDGDHTVTVRVTDDGTPTLDDSETFTITVNEVNVAPVLGAIGDRTVQENTELSFTATATDADLPANTLTFSLDAGAPAGAAIDPTTGVFSWTPTSGQLGDHTVTVRVTDDGTPVLDDFETFTINVGQDPNQNPVLGAIGDQTVDEETELSFTATATDADLGDALTFSLDAGAPAGATIDPTTGVFSWTPTETQDGDHTVTVRVTDDGTPTLDDSETFTITVNEVNVAPVLGAIGDRTVDEETELSFTATATDADLPANTLTFSLDAGAPAGATIDPTTGVFSWTPTSGQLGDHTVTVRVTDDGTPVLDDFETFTINVGQDPNQNPVLGAIGDQTVDEETELSFTATATDADLGDALTFSLDAGAPAGATIDPTTGVFSWTPTETQDGDHTVTVRVTDDGTPTLDDSETFTITVNEVNVAPVLGAIGDRTVDEETELSFTATATDADLPANTLTFSLDAGAPAGATIDPTTGVFSWTPTETQDGDHTVTVRVTDDGTPTLDDSETFTITVNEVNVPTNTPPTIDNPGTQNGTEDVPGTILLTGITPGTGPNDAGQTVTLSAMLSNPTFLQTASIGPINSSGEAVLTYTPAANVNGSVEITVTADDGQSGNNISQVTFTLNLAAVNDDPEIVSTPEPNAKVGEEYVYQVSIEDPDAGDTHEFEVLDGPDGMEVDGNGQVTWTPAAGQVGQTFDVSVKVTDSQGAMDIQNFTIMVEEPSVFNDPNNDGFSNIDDVFFLLQFVGQDLSNDDLEDIRNYEKESGNDNGEWDLGDIIKWAAGVFGIIFNY